MSASREKKKRFDERGEGVEKRQIRAKDNQKVQKRKKLITTIAAAAVVVVLLFLVVFNSTLFYTGMTALKAGDWNFTNADFNYEYFNNYYNTYATISQNYGDYAYLLLDPNTPLDEQNYSETQTWDAYFEESAFNQLQQMAILNDMGKAEGWKLSSEQKAEVDAAIENVKTSAISQGYSDYRAYLRAMYGKGMNEDHLRELLETSFYATYYSQELLERWKDSYSEEEKAAAYDEVRKDYDLISYMMYYVESVVDEENGIDATAAMAAASDIAVNIAAAADQETFADAVLNFAPEEEKGTYEDPEACLYRNRMPSAINSEWAGWLTDSARVYGETKIFNDAEGYYVLMYLDTNPNEYRLASFRGIVIPVAKDEATGAYTDATLSAAESVVDEIITAYNEDPTEETFADLANTYNTDGSTNGGLYENIAMGQLDNYDLETYIFDDSRTVGEVSSFYKDGNYYVVYFAGRSEQNYNLMIGEDLKVQEQYASLIEGAKGDYPVSTKFAFRFAK